MSGGSMSGGAMGGGDPRLDMYRPENVNFEDFQPPQCLLHNKRRYEFDPRNVVFAEIKARPNRGRVVDLGYHLVVPEENINTVVHPIQLQTPVLRTPFGISSSSFANSDVSYALDLGFGDITMNKEAEMFFKAMALFDKIVAEKAVANFRDPTLPGVKKWINDPNLVPEMLPMLYKKMTAIRQTKSTGAQYPPRLTLKIGCRQNHLEVSCFDPEMQPVDPTAVTKGCQVRAIIRFNGLWFQSRSYSLSLYVQQVHLLGHGNQLSNEPGFVVDDSTGGPVFPSASAENSSNENV